ncbi:MAG TPA: hypothetical protein VHB21_06755, partial [Minicystis sp.]|nr:hypothetical protein [Minicystis sp.]
MRGFEHQDAERKSDASLAEEARAFLAGSPARQLVAEILHRLRATEAPFWSPEALRQRFPAEARMRWLAERPDVRQRVTSKLTGLAPKAARKKTPEFQAALVDSVLDEGDVSAKDFDAAFEAEELAVYGPADAIWRAFLDAIPWDARGAAHEELAAWLLDALLASTSGLAGAFARRPILTPLDVRQAIDAAAWHAQLPLDVRVAIDRARLAQERERPGVPFGAADELAFATPAVL